MLSDPLPERLSNGVKLSSVSTERRAPLDRRRVADTALTLLNEVGLDGLTLRAIARELDVKAPALYWHFKDKQALLDEMATEMFRRMTDGVESDPDDGWRERLLRSNRVLRRTLLAYRDGAKVFGGTRFTGLEHAEHQEATLRLLTSAGLTLAQAARALQTTFLYTLGFVAEEQGVEPMPGERREGFDVEARARLMADHPLAAEAGQALFGDYDKNFEEGLALIITGIETRYGVN
ncbi:TetR/AcrR family tetracycline transcriptional repressor [Streptomyces albogriseolus]